MTSGLPVGLYHVPFVGYRLLGIGSYSPKVGYPKRKGYGMSLQVDNYQYHFPVCLKYLIFWIRSGYGTIIMVIIEAPTHIKLTVADSDHGV